MPTFECGATSAAIVTAAAYTTLLTTAARRAAIREIGVFAGTAVATGSFVGEGIPANTPTTTTSIVPQAKDAADAVSTALVVTVWGTAPTAPAVFRRKACVGAVVGAGIIWKFALDERTWLAKTTWEVLWNFGAATSALLSYYYEYDE